MTEAVRRFCKEALAEKRLDVIYGVRDREGVALPHFFETPEDLDRLVLENRHPLAFTCRPRNEDVLALFQGLRSGARVGVVARGCDERTIFELAKRSQVDLARIEFIGVACDQAQAEACRCSRPYPQNLRFGEKVAGVAEDPATSAFLAKGLDERLAFWRYQLSKCIKCYGCRNACPMCFCETCRMEQAMWTQTGRVPPEFPMFHFVQVLHHADRCVDCGECERACPMDIPLRLLKKSMREAVREMFGYEAGADATTESPFARRERGAMHHAE